MMRYDELRVEREENRRPAKEYRLDPEKLAEGTGRDMVLTHHYIANSLPPPKINTQPSRHVPYPLQLLPKKLPLAGSSRRRTPL